MAAEVSAERLPRAATLMRETARATPGGIWHGAGSLAKQHSLYWTDAEHIASWSPLVALAVADWLDETALRWEYVEEKDLALAVANAYLDAAGVTP